jgi:lipoic acid synthetase
MSTTPQRKPEWLRKKISFSAQKEMDQLLHDVGLHTICQEAMCPNISECFEHKQATFLILGTTCTRRCTYCNVDTGMPASVNPDEITQVTEAVQRLGLRYVVITSPARDDLSDGGAAHFYAVTQHLRAHAPQTTVELLIPDFKGDIDAIQMVLRSGAAVIGHNVETVPRLYHVRKGAKYEKSLEVLRNLKLYDPAIKTKSALMVGLGERSEEMEAVFADLLEVGCSYLSIGQYLAPSNDYEKVVEYVRPSQFEAYKQTALEMGFEYVHSSPYTRSSYMAHEYQLGNEEA